VQCVARSFVCVVEVYAQRKIELLLGRHCAWGVVQTDWYCTESLSSACFATVSSSMSISGLESTLPSALAAACPFRWMRNARAYWRWWNSANMVGRVVANPALFGVVAMSRATQLRKLGQHECMLQSLSIACNCSGSVRRIQLWCSGELCSFYMACAGLSPPRHCRQHRVCSTYRWATTAKWPLLRLSWCISARPVQILLGSICGGWSHQPSCSVYPGYSPQCRTVQPARQQCPLHRRALTACLHCGVGSRQSLG